MLKALRRNYLSVLLVVLGLVIISAYGVTWYLKPTSTTAITTTTTSNLTSTERPSAAENVTIQSDLLSFIGQQAIAHAGVTFATLTAAFGFAAAFKNPRNLTAKWIYVAILGILLGGGIYAGLRLFFYGQMWGFILKYPPEYAFQTSYCIQPGHIYLAQISKTGITAYWECMIWIVYGSNWVLDYLGTTAIAMLVSMSAGLVLSLLVTYFVVLSGEQSHAKPFLYMGLAFTLVTLILAHLSYWSDLAPLVCVLGATVGGIVAITVIGLLRFISGRHQKPRFYSQESPSADL